MDLCLSDINQCACSGKHLDRLLRPTILAMLARQQSYGYQLIQMIQTMALFQDGPPDISGVYKALKKMEAEGLAISEWNIQDAGPAKRMYRISQRGRDCLDRWKETLETFRIRIGELLACMEQSTPHTNA